MLLFLQLRRLSIYTWPLIFCILISVIFLFFFFRKKLVLIFNIFIEKLICSSPIVWVKDTFFKKIKPEIWASEGSNYEDTKKIWGLDDIYLVFKHDELSIEIICKNNEKKKNLELIETFFKNLPVGIWNVEISPNGVNYSEDPNDFIKNFNFEKNSLKFYADEVSFDMIISSDFYLITDEYPDEHFERLYLDVYINNDHNHPKNPKFKSQFEGKEVIEADLSLFEKKFLKTLTFLFVLFFVIFIIFIIYSSPIISNWNIALEYVKIFSFFILFYFISNGLEFLLTKNFLGDENEECSFRWYKKIDHFNYDFKYYRQKQKENYILLDLMFDILFAPNKIVLISSLIISCFLVPFINIFTRISFFFSLLYLSLIYFYSIFYKKKISIKLNIEKYDSFSVGNFDLLKLILYVISQVKAFCFFYLKLNKSEFKKDQILKAWEKAWYYRSFGLSLKKIEFAFLIKRAAVATLVGCEWKKKKKSRWFFIFKYYFLKNFKEVINKDVSTLFFLSSHSKIYLNKDIQTNNKFIEFEKTFYHRLMKETLEKKEGLILKKNMTFVKHPAQVPDIKFSNPEKLSIFQSQSKSNFILDYQNKKLNSYSEFKDFGFKEIYRQNAIGFYFMHLRIGSQKNLSDVPNAKFVEHNYLNKDLVREFNLTYQSFMVKEGFGKVEEIAYAHDKIEYKKNKNIFLPKKEIFELKNLNLSSEKMIKEDFYKLDEMIEEMGVELNIQPSVLKEYKERILIFTNTEKSTEIFRLGLFAYFEIENFSLEERKIFLENHNLQDILTNELEWKNNR